MLHVAPSLDMRVEDVSERIVAKFTRRHLFARELERWRVRRRHFGINTCFTLPSRQSLVWYHDHSVFSVFQ